MGKHKYPSEAEVRRLAASDPLAAACAAGGGHLLRVTIPKLRLVGRGCGSPWPVLGTSSNAPCGVTITNLRGDKNEHLCSYCAESNANEDAQIPSPSKPESITD